MGWLSHSRASPTGERCGWKIRSWPQSASTGHLNPVNRGMLCGDTDLHDLTSLSRYADAGHRHSSLITARTDQLRRPGR